MEKENKQNIRDREVKKFEITKIGKRNASIIILLGIAGQIAWAVENSWFNTFVYDELTPNPLPIALMVAVSAITATITTLIMGSVSDRTHSKWGRRKPFIVLGYILWGIVTALFPTVSFIPIVGIAVVMVIIVDAIMTFFGSTANDAAYNAWITDIGDSTNRNRINSINQATVLIANLIALGVAGIIIDAFGYFIFFYILGGIVSISGLVAGLMIKDKPVPMEERDTSKKVWSDLKESLSIEDIKENRLLYLLFLNMGLVGIADMIFFPYVFIYMENYLGFSKTLIGIVGLFVIGISTILILLLGFLITKINRKNLLIIFILLSAMFSFILAFFTNILFVTVFYMLYLTFSMSTGFVRAGWMQDKYPRDSIGKFQGVRLIFMVLIPMVIGPLIGAAIIERFGTPIVVDGQPGYIPTPPLIIISALMSLLALIPLALIKKSEGRILFHETRENNQ